MVSLDKACLRAAAWTKAPSRRRPAVDAELQRLKTLHWPGKFPPTLSDPILVPVTLSMLSHDPPFSSRIRAGTPSVHCLVTCTNPVVILLQQSSVAFQSGKFSSVHSFGQSFSFSDVSRHKQS